MKSIGITKQNGADDYSEICTLSSGKTKSVVLAKDKVTDETVVITRLERGSQINEALLNGLLNHRRLFMAHIVDFIKCYVTEKHFCIVTEYAPGGTLLRFLIKHKGIEECVGRWLFQQLMIALDYCHKLGIAAGNISLENIVLDVDNTWPILKFRDFLSSTSEKQIPIAKRQTNPPFFLAPEIIAGNKDYDPKMADVWCCGVLLYIMVYNCYPFIAKGDLSRPDSARIVEQRILKSPLVFRREVASSPAVKDLLKKMLQKDPNKRLSVEKIMEHGWYRHNLPKGALDMNTNISVEEHGLQSEEEIGHLVKQAKVPFEVEAKFFITDNTNNGDNDEDNHTDGNKELVYC